MAKQKTRGDKFVGNDKSCVAYGMDGLPGTVEVDVGVGLAAFNIVGLPDALVKESRERVRSALKNSGVVKIARTIADLADETQIKVEHIAEAIQYRTLDRKEFNDF